MLNQPVYDQAVASFRDCYGAAPTVAAYAPGRVEVLGNHTDYNEGYVLSAAIDAGTFFLAGPSGTESCQLIAGDIMEQVAFPCRAPEATVESGWANYVKGVCAGLQDQAPLASGFNGLFLGSIPLGAGLSSSAALEISAALALCALYGITRTPLELARIGQRAEHEFAGVKCGLMDQISSLHGKRGALVLSDFRTLEVETVPLGDAVCFLLCNTHARHALVDGAYNERRRACETAAAWFDRVLDHPVTALRDVSCAEWEAHHDGLDPVIARRALHPISENERVLAGREALLRGDLEAFGRLMFASHESSIHNFENSCPELDFIVDACHRLPGVLGARLSGGGFGGSVVALVQPSEASAVGSALQAATRAQFGQACGIQLARPSDGARQID